LLNITSKFNIVAIFVVFNTQYSSHIEFVGMTCGQYT